MADSATIAGISFIVGAGGGFKQVLITTCTGQVIVDAVEGSAVSVLFLAWLVAVLVRVATPGPRPSRRSPRPASWTRSPPI